MEQILLHLWGDYIFQTDTQAKGKKCLGWYGTWCCFKHCLTYSLPFLLIGSWKAWLVIFVTHFIIDRTKLIDYLMAIKNGVYKIKKPPHNYGMGDWYDKKVPDISNFGFALDRPQILTLWLYIIVDNIFHITINYFALKYL